ncbi:MAG: type I restriction enzyme S subunit [Arenicella sp.]|jgi:type I restriction enzyme S subunit
MSEIENLITEKLDIWTGAVKPKSSVGRGRGKGNSGKFELYGISKLRKLILDLAVRGLLVPQDRHDEPVSELLKQIAIEKAKLVTDQKIKQQKPLPQIDDSETPFALPTGWEWVRLGDIGIGSTGKTPSTKEVKYFNGKIPFVGPGQITPSGELLEPDKYLSEEGLEHSTEALAGDILMVCIGGSIGKNVICGRRIAFNQQINAIRPLLINPVYLNSAMSTEHFFQCVLDKSSGTATPIINRSKWEELLIPVSPIPEQRRIVAKVDELMALCDQLEQQTEASLTAHQTLVETLLSALTNAADSNAFNDAWQRIAQHFDTLFTTEQSIDQLKQTILQLAVMGKLVPQDANDEPAAVTLSRISDKKARLIDQGAIRRQSELPKIEEGEKPFLLPSGWSFSRLDEVSLNSEAGWSPRCESVPREGSNWGVLKVSAVTWGKFNPGENKALPEGLQSRPRLEVRPGDFLISRANTAELVARAVIVPQSVPRKLIMSDKIIRFVFPDEVNAHYVSLVNNSILSRSYYLKVAGGTSSSMKNVSRKQIRSLIIGVPPLSEQYRIVAKVDKLSSVCDELKNSNKEFLNTKLLLANSIVEKYR